MNQQKKLRLGEFMNLAFERTHASDHIQYNDWNPVRDSLSNTFQATFGKRELFARDEIVPKLAEFTVAARGCLEQFVEPVEANALAQQISHDLYGVLFDKSPS
jgi:hypothetical protein